MAPMMSVPSRPRLMRPERSVMHSPRLTKRKGVLTRIAPEKMARGGPQMPKPVSATEDLLFLEDLEAAVVGFAGEDEDEDEALEDVDGGIRQPHAALQQAAA